MPGLPGWPAVLSGLVQQGVYMAPDWDQQWSVKNPAWLRPQIMNSEAAGMTASLYAFSHASLGYDDAEIGEYYHLLFDYAICNFHQ